MFKNILQMFNNLLNNIKQITSSKCEYEKTCTHYRENSHNCNHEPENCGIFKRTKRGLIKK
jgi:hypothetical protein